MENLYEVVLSLNSRDKDFAYIDYDKKKDLKEICQKDDELVKKIEEIEDLDLFSTNNKYWLLVKEICGLNR